jgi:hypothetical protein
VVNRFKLFDMRPPKHSANIATPSANPRVFGSALHGHDIKGSDMDFYGNQPSA